MIVREPIVAGTFYNLDKEMLKSQIKKCFDHSLGPKKMEKKEFSVAIVPHAGYSYSGSIAAHVYAQIEKANYIILGTNHSGMGTMFSLMKEGLWKTPLGEVEIERGLSEKLTKENSLIEQDVMAHEHEHSIEVQLPFLQYRFGNDFKFIPLCIMPTIPDTTFLEKCVSIGKTIAEILKKEDQKWIVLASSDFTHYEPYEYTMATDKYLIDSIIKLKEKEFFNRLQEKHASVCGYGAISVAMVIAKELGSKKGKLLKYANSGDITGDKSSVVGYASITF